LNPVNPVKLSLSFMSWKRVFAPEIMQEGALVWPVFLIGAQEPDSHTSAQVLICIMFKNGWGKHEVIFIKS
jgi:hypothetical protein